MAEGKIDLYKMHKTEYVAPKKPTFVKVGKASYLTICGNGAPGGEIFQTKIGALYGVAFTIKMTHKFEGSHDYTVSKLEGQYWSDDNKAGIGGASPEDLHWRLLIRTPDFINKKDLKEAARKLIEKDKGEAVEEVELSSLAEGKCVQMLHIGPYDKESGTIEQMLAFTRAEDHDVDGHRHEIYLSDPRRVAPEKLKTILRLPVGKRRAV